MSDLIKDAITRHKDALINADETRVSIKEKEKEFRSISKQQALTVEDRNREYK